MLGRTYCDFCNAEMELGREFVYQFESLNFLDDESELERIRLNEDYHGEPLRLCNACSQGVERNRREQIAEKSDDDRRARAASIIFTVGLTLTALMLAIRYAVAYFRQ